MTTDPKLHVIVTYMTHSTLQSSTQVEQRIIKLAHDIIVNFPDKKPLFVALLRGAAPFASKLMFEISNQNPDFHPELDYMMVQTYGDKRTAGEPRIITDLAPDTVVNGRIVILTDDVLDKGITAHFVINYLKSLGADEVQLAVLAVKRTERKHDITPDYYGFEVEDKWLVGMGMDDASSGKEHDRWLGSIEAVN